MSFSKQPVIWKRKSKRNFLSQHVKYVCVCVSRVARCLQKKKPPLCFQYLLQRARALSLRMVENVVALSRTFNRGICDHFERIVRSITSQSVRTDDLVRQIEYVENLRVTELLELRVSTNAHMGLLFAEKYFRSSYTDHKN